MASGGRGSKSGDLEPWNIGSRIPYKRYRERSRAEIEILHPPFQGSNFCIPHPTQATHDPTTHTPLPPEPTHIHHSAHVSIRYTATLAGSSHPPPLSLGPSGDVERKGFPPRPFTSYLNTRCDTDWLTCSSNLKCDRSIFDAAHGPR